MTEYNFEDFKRNVPYLYNREQLLKLNQHTVSIKKI